MSVFSDEPVAMPAVVPSMYRDSADIGFALASEPRTGALLRALAATKPGGRLLEMGTGTGIGTAWLLHGMDAGARLVSVESDATVLDVARRHLAHDPRVTFHHGDGAAFLEQSPPDSYDLVYADTWAGKFTHLELALALVRRGGLYVIDDLLPQPNWPADHAPKVPRLVEALEARQDFVA